MSKARGCGATELERRALHVKHHDLHRSVVAVLLVAVSLLSFSRGAVAQTDESVAEFVSLLESSARATRSMDNRGRCRDMFTRILDMDAVMRGVASDFWARMNATQRSAFRSALDSRLLGECA